MKLRVLGCGTSTGVPRIGSGWGECDPAEPRNRRLRAALLIESCGSRALIDCGPDLREQMLAADVHAIECVIVTHDHADHCHGIDDLRPFAQKRRQPIPIYASEGTLEQLGRRFGYIFQGSAFYPAVAERRSLPAELIVGEARLRFVEQPHGSVSSVGIRIDEGSRSATYAIDFSEMTAEMKALYKGVDVMICDCLSRRPHPTHAHLDAVLGWAAELAVGQLYLSHLNNSMDYRSLLAELPEWAAPAYDGLVVDLG